MSDELFQLYGSGGAGTTFHSGLQLCKTRVCSDGSELSWGALPFFITKLLCKWHYLVWAHLIDRGIEGGAKSLEKQGVGVFSGALVLSLRALVRSPRLAF